MGIRISSKTWRAPLQFIDSWLPSPAPHSRAHHQPLAHLLQRFARAGWLGHRAARVDQGQAGVSEPAQRHAVPPTQTPPVRIVRPAQGARGNTRLVISGRMSDVCAELDRLATMEQHAGAT